MKHVPNGREERNTARDGTQVPMKKNSQGWDPRTHERKSSANSRRGCGLIVRAMGKDVSENSMPVVKVEKLVLNARVGEGGDRLVRAEKALQQTERRIQSHTESLGSQKGERKKFPTMMRSSIHCGK